jgi:hypothetical protein
MTNYNNLLRNTREKAKDEVEALSTPQALGEDLAQVAQVGERTAAARSTLRNVYGSNKLSYLKGLGRTGDETTLGVKPLAQAISKRVGTIRATPELSTAVEQPTVEQPTEINVSITSPDPPPQPSSGEGGSAPEGAAVSEGTAAESSIGIPAVENATLKTGLSTAADLGAKAGIGLGILGGANALAQDFSGGHLHLSGDNSAEKAGNAMSMA